MKAIVLGTRSLIEEYERYEPFFGFYEHGIRDLVKEDVLSHSTTSPFATTHHPSSLVETVPADYGYAFDCYRESCEEEEAKPQYDEQFLAGNLDVIRYAAHGVEEAVANLFRPHLPTRYRQGEALRPRWIGSDLRVHVRLLN
jgi:hypothetical protein